MTAAVPSFVKEPFDFMAKAQRIVLDYIGIRVEHGLLTTQDISVYWFSKTEENWEVRLSTPLPDSVYYRVIHDNHKHETRLDVYHLFDTHYIKDKETV